MSISDKIIQIAQKQQEIYEAGLEAGRNASSYAEGFTDGYKDGKQSEYDRFWDSFQVNGTRGDYNSAFKTGWTDETFNPKYDFIITVASQMFQYSKITTLASKLKEKGLKLDTSAISGTQAIQMFQGTSVKDIPELDLRNCTNIGWLFGSNAKVETVEKLIISEKATQNASNWFSGAARLTHIIFDGVLAATGMSLSQSTLLDKESIVSLVNILSTTTSGLTVTLSLQAVNKAFETSEGANDGSNSTEWQTLIDTKKNWTINLA